MKKIKILSVLLILSFVSLALGQSVSEVWIIPADDANAAAWQAAGNARGIDFNANSTHTGNTVIIADHTGNIVHVHNAADGSYLWSLDTTGVGPVFTGHTVSPYRVAVTEDGQIFANSFDGIIVKWADDAASTVPSIVIDLSGETGNSRSLEAVGSGNNVRILFSKGTDIRVFDDNGTGAFVESVGRTIATGWTAECEAIASADSNLVYASKIGSGGDQKPFRRVYELTATGYVNNETLVAALPYISWFQPNGLDVGAGYYILAEAAGAYDGFAIGTIAGANYNPESGDTDADNVYDGGMNGASTVADIAFDPTTLSAYWTTAGTGATAGIGCIKAIEPPPASDGDLVINEIHYNPASSQGTDELYEFVEIYNTTTASIDLTGLTLESGTNVVDLSGNTIAANDFVVVAYTGATYSSLTCPVIDVGAYFGLSNTASTFLIKYGDTVIDSVSYDDDGDPWPSAADGGGPSLELKDPLTDNALGENWQASYVVGGTPGQVNSTLPPVFDWELDINSYSFFKNDHFTRGIAYNPATGHLLIASRTGGNNVFILDAATGDSLSKLDMIGVSGGTYAMNIIRVNSDGVIYLGNLGGISGSIFKIYRWENESAAPTVAFEGAVAQRTGDSFGLYGTGTSTTLYASGSGSTHIYAFTTSDGLSYAITDTITVASGLARGGISSIGNGEFWVDGAGTSTSHIASNGSVIAAIDGNLVDIGWHNVAYIPTSGGRKLVSIVGRNSTVRGNQVQVWDITSSEMNPALLDTVDLTSTYNANVNASGDLAFKDNGNGTITIYEMITNNGIAAWTLAVPPAIPELTIAEAKVDANGDFVPDLLNETVTIQGVVTTPNYDSNTNYHLQDATAGICLQTFSFTSGLNPGDEVTITGKITQYNGLTQINPASETDVAVTSTGNVIEPSKITISELGESTEGLLVEADSVWIVNLADWPAEGSNADIDLTDGIDTVTLRIDKETDLDGWTPPAGMMKLIAVGSQYTSATPPDDGYQLIGTFREHFMEIIIHPEPEELYTWWEKNAGDYTFFQSDNNTRGMDLNPVTGHLLVASRTGGNNIHVLEAENGTFLSGLDMTDVSGGIFPITLVSVANDGVTYGCNLTTSGTGFKFYRWGDESSTPTVAFEGDLDQRVGDSFTVIGSGANTIVYASGSNVTKIYVFTTTDGINFSLFDEVPIGSSLARGGIAPVADTLGSDIWVNCSGKQAALIDTSGTIITTIDTSMHVYFAHIDYMETGDGRKLIAVAGGNCGDVPACMRSEVWDVTDPFNPWRFAYGSMTNTPVANVNGTGIAILEEKENGVLNLYHLLSNNGIALYSEEEFIPPILVDVTFEVNMSVQTILGNFNIASDFVDIAGNFNEWGGNAMVLDDADGDSVYFITVVDLHPGENLEYKFRINGSWDDATCEFPFEGPNRTYVVPDTNSVVFHWYDDKDRSALGIEDVSALPKEFALNQNYPNPFNPTTFIKYDLPKEAAVRIVIYDLMGKEVRTLVNEKQNAGYESILWNGRDNQGRMVSSGLYIYQMITDEFQKTRKMVLLK
ncbi:MAG: DUF4623 domain-containing protein [bacterium]